jgi:CRISPR/Cas system-associated protein Csm6
MQEWQQKLHDFSEKAEAKGQASTIAAEHDLNGAWTKTEAEADKLQTASAADWESAKISYEEASRDLAGTWDKIRPEDK